MVCAHRLEKNFQTHMEMKRKESMAGWKVELIEIRDAASTAGRLPDKQGELALSRGPVCSDSSERGAVSGYT